jgi:hypothetical protein
MFIVCCIDLLLGWKWIRFIICDPIIRRRVSGRLGAGEMCAKSPLPAPLQVYTGRMLGQC